MPGISGITGVSSLLRTDLALPGTQTWGSRSTTDKAEKAYLREAVRPLAARLLQERRTEKTWQIGPLTVRYESVEGAGQESKDAARQLALIAESFKARQSGNASPGNETGESSAGLVFGESTGYLNTLTAGKVGASESGNAFLTGQKAETVFAQASDTINAEAVAQKTESSGIGVWNSSVAATVIRTIATAEAENAFPHSGMPASSTGNMKVSQNFARKTLQAISAYMKMATSFTSAPQCMPSMAV